MTQPLLLTGRNAPNIKTLTVTVPAGHKLPNGTEVKFPFTVLVQAGARWHPDWDAPRYSVIAYKVLAMGDAVGFSGETAKAFPLPDWVADLAGAHGLPAGPGHTIGTGRGIYVPFKPEKITDFVLPHHVMN